MLDIKANAKEIGRRIAALRTVAGQTQEDLAAAIGKSRSFIAGLESGGDTPGLGALILVADELKVPLDWLLGRSVPVGGPLVGKFVNDMDELAWLAFWQSLNDSERSAALRLLNIPAPHRQVA